MVQLMKNCRNPLLLIQKLHIPPRTHENNWIIQLIPKWPPSGKNWDELHGNEDMRAKSDIFSVSPKTFRTKLQTSYDKEEKTSQIHCMFPIYQCASYQYAGKCSWWGNCRHRSALGEVTVDTEERRIKVLVTLSGWLVQRTVNLNPARKKLRLLYSPEMSAVWVIQN